MAKKDITERIDELNPDTINWSDPGAYAAMGIGEDDGEGDEQPQGDSTNGGQAPAAAATPAPAAPAVTATPAPAPAQRSEAPAAAASTEGEPERPQGVATRDGRHVIPYAVLEQARERTRQLEQQNQQLQEQLAAAANRADPSGSSELAQRAQSDPDSLTPAELEELAADFPSLAKPLQMMVKMREQITALASRPAAPVAASAAAPAAAPAPRTVAPEEELDLAIAANPLIGQWMSARGDEWARARAIDSMLLQDPKYAGISATERLAKVQAMVAAEFGIKAPAAATPAPAPQPQGGAAPAPAARDSAFPSLGDMGGTAPLSDEDQVNALPSTDLLAKYERMSDAELMRQVGLGY